MLNNSLTALGGQNLNLVTTGAGQVLVNGDVVTSSGNFNTLAAQVAANTTSIGVGDSPAVVTPSIVAQLGTLATDVFDAETAAFAAQSDATLALSGSANDSTARTSAGNAQNTANSALTSANQARTYTLLGATIGGVVANVKGVGIANPWLATTFILASTIQIKVPPGWVAGASVFFDGYGYYNFSSTIVSFWAIYYVTSTQPTEQSLIGVKLANNSIAPPASVAQIYLPMNLTIPPTNLTAGGTITIRVYGYVTTAGEYLSDDPLIDARVGLAFP